MYIQSSIFNGKGIKYFENQKEHHKSKTYAQEYEGYVKFYQQTIRKQANK